MTHQDMTHQNQTHQKITRQKTLLRFIAFTALVLAAISPAARAIGPSGDVFAGYSNIEGESGWEVAAHLKVLPFIGIEGDVSGYSYRSNPTSYLFLVGPRATGSLGRAHVFVHGLVGGGRTFNNSSDSAFLYALGGGLDVPIVSRLNWRVSGDFISAPTNGSLGNKTGRVSTGPVLRF